MQISSGTKQKWIEKGYEHFALYGPAKLSINKISKEIELSRASFYHYFADLELFIEELLDLHWQVNQDFASIGAKECKKYSPDLYLLLEKYPIPLQFSKQLFLNRNIPAYNYLFMKILSAIGSLFCLKLFSEQFNIRNDEDACNLWQIVVEAWYSRLDVNDLTAKKMAQLEKEIMDSVVKFRSSDLYSNIQNKSSKN